MASTSMSVRDAGGNLQDISQDLIGGLRVGQALPPASIGNDQSANAPALLGLLQTIAANSDRIGFAWQNQSAGDLQVVLYDAAGTSYSVIISTGVSANGQGDAGSLSGMGIRHTGKIEVRGATGAQFMAREF